jgi:hypothetical protein
VPYEEIPRDRMLVVSEREVQMLTRLTDVKRGAR